MIVLLQTEATARRYMSCALVHVKLTIDSHAAVLLVTHINTAFKQMPNVPERGGEVFRTVSRGCFLSTLHRI